MWALQMTYLKLACTSTVQNQRPMRQSRTQEVVYLRPLPWVVTTLTFPRLRLVECHFQGTPGCYRSCAGDSALSVVSFAVGSQSKFLWVGKATKPLDALPFKRTRNDFPHNEWPLKTCWYLNCGALTAPLKNWTSLDILSLLSAPKNCSHFTNLSLSSIRDT